MALPLLLVRPKEAHPSVGSLSNLEPGRLLGSSQGDADLDLLGQVGVDGVDFGTVRRSGVFDFLISVRFGSKKRGGWVCKEGEEREGRRGRETDSPPRSTSLLVHSPSTPSG